MDYPPAPGDNCPRIVPDPVVSPLPLRYDGPGRAPVRRKIRPRRGRVVSPGRNNHDRTQEPPVRMHALRRVLRETGLGIFQSDRSRAGGTVSSDHAGGVHRAVRQRQGWFLDTRDPPEELPILQGPFLRDPCGAPRAVPQLSLLGGAHPLVEGMGRIVPRVSRRGQGKSA